MKNNKANSNGRMIRIDMILMLFNICSSYPVKCMLFGMIPLDFSKISLNPLVYRRGNKAETKGVFNSRRNSPKKDT
jgi:hypothetical protein